MATQCNLTEEVDPLLAQLERSLEWLRRNRSDEVVSLVITHAPKIGVPRATQQPHALGREDPLAH